MKEREILSRYTFFQKNLCNRFDTVRTFVQVCQKRYNSAADFTEIYVSLIMRRSFGEIVLNEGGPLRMICFVKSHRVGLESWD